MRSTNEKFGNAPLCMRHPVELFFSTEWISIDLKRCHVAQVASSMLLKSKITPKTRTPPPLQVDRLFLRLPAVPSRPFWNNRRRRGRGRKMRPKGVRVKEMTIELPLRASNSSWYYLHCLPSSTQELPPFPVQCEGSQKSFTVSQLQLLRHSIGKGFWPYSTNCLPWHIPPGQFYYHGWWSSNYLGLLTRVHAPGS